MTEYERAKKTADRIAHIDAVVADAIQRMYELKLTKPADVALAVRFALNNAGYRIRQRPR